MSLNTLDLPRSARVEKPAGDDGRPRVEILEAHQRHAQHADVLAVLLTLPPAVGRGWPARKAVPRRTVSDSV